MEITLLIGRVLFSLPFVLLGINHFTKREALVAYSQMMNAPAPSIGVPVTGLMVTLGGISIMLGYFAQIGAGLIIVFLVIVTPLMHKFWGVEDEQMAQTQMIMFLKNLSMIGGALIIIYFGSGPYSIN